MINTQILQKEYLHLEVQQPRRKDFGLLKIDKIPTPNSSKDKDMEFEAIGPY